MLKAEPPPDGAGTRGRLKFVRPSQSRFAQAKDVPRSISASLYGSSELPIILNSAAVRSRLTADTPRSCPSIRSRIRSVIFWAVDGVTADLNR